MAIDTQTNKDLGKDFLDTRVLTIKDRGYVYKLLDSAGIEIIYTLRISKKVFDFINKVNKDSYNKQNIWTGNRMYYNKKGEYIPRCYIHMSKTVKYDINMISRMEETMYTLKKTLMSITRNNKIRLMQQEIAEINSGDYVPKCMEDSDNKTFFETVSDGANPFTFAADMEGQDEDIFK